jgi:hypothetical protein
MTGQRRVIGMETEFYARNSFLLRPRCNYVARLQSEYIAERLTFISDLCEAPRHEAGEYCLGRKHGWNAAPGAAPGDAIGGYSHGEE